MSTRECAQEIAAVSSTTAGRWATPEGQKRAPPTEDKLPGPNSDAAWPHGRVQKPRAL